MRRLFWLFLFLAGYVWVSLTGNEELLIQRGKALYRIALHWLEDAEIDYHFDASRSSSGKRSRRWD